MKTNENMAEKAMVAYADNPISQVHTSLQESWGGPAHFRISTDTCKHLPPLGDWDLAQGISPDRKRVFYSHSIRNPETNINEMHLDVWNVESLELERKFVSPDLAGEFCPHYTDEKFTMLRDGCFLGNDHIVLALGSGHVRVLSIADGDVWIEEKLGGNVAGVVWSPTHLAVSLFPGNPDRCYESCGIKFCDVDSIINKREFETTEFIYPIDLLSVLPNKIRYNQNYTKLLCRGSILKEKGYVNVLESLDLESREVVTWLTEPDRVQSNSFSNESDNGSYIYGGKECFQLVGPDVTQPTQEVPEELKYGRVSYYLAPDSRKAFLRRQGKVYLYEPPNTLVNCMQDLGYVLKIQFITNKEILVTVNLGNFYDLVIMNADILQVQWKLSEKLCINTIEPEAYDISLDGTLFVGDREGFVRTYGNDLSYIKSASTERGALRKVLADPFENRVALLTFSQAVMMFVPEDEKPKIHISISKKKPVETASGYRNIAFPTFKPGTLFMRGSVTSRFLNFDGVRHMSCGMNSTCCRVSDYISPDTETVAEFSLDAPVSAMTELKGWGIFLLENGKLFAIDAHNFELEEDISGDKVLNENSPYYVEITEDINAPRGLCRIPDNRLVVWTQDTIMLLEVSEELRLIGKKTQSVTGIQNIKWDRCNDRLVLAYDDYLSFWSMDLKEMYRLYILPNGKHVIHVPYPERLRTGLNRDHPGYFWSNTDCFHLFDVLDRDGNETLDENRKQDFLKEYFDEFMVREATTDYEGFCGHLGYPDPADELVIGPRLLPMGVT